MAEKSFLDRAAAYTYDELERLGGDMSKLDLPQQTMAILYSEQAIIDNGGFKPQGSHQKRPTVVTSKPANGSGRGLGCFTPLPPEEASLFSYANSVDHI